jgi:hypothetical protein
MFHRINFLIPNASLAQKVVTELNELGVSNKHIHTYAEHNYPTNGLNLATENQINDEARQVEDVFWKGNLLLFFIFSAICITALITQQYSLALLAIIIMILSFMAGNFFVKHIPHTHLSEFKHATCHNELLMMIDVADNKVEKIENAIHRHHPAAYEAGSSWTLKSIDI